MSLSACPSSCSCEDEYVLKCLECPPREYSHYGLPEHYICKLVDVVTSRSTEHTSRAGARVEPESRMEALQIASLVLTALGLLVGAFYLLARW